MKYTFLILIAVLSSLLILDEHQVHADILYRDYNYVSNGLDDTAGGSVSSIDGFGGPVDRDNMIVPEPTTMLLLGTSMIGLAAFGRRRFKKG